MVTVKTLPQQLLKNIEKGEFQKARREVTFAGESYKNPDDKQILLRLIIKPIRRIYCGDFPWLFATRIWRRNLSWLLSIEICRGYLSFVFISKSCLYESKPFLYVSKTFLFVGFSLLTVFFFVIAVAVIGHRTKQKTNIKMKKAQIIEISYFSHAIGQNYITYHVSWSFVIFFRHICIFHF